uniref:Histone-lysine N-methyltransferase SETD1A (Trinotate prediction) n=1 Tax=Henneguya salminicola TaxID=69463 RepID=A0A6G3MF87_HENSL
MSEHTSRPNYMLVVDPILTPSKPQKIYRINGKHIENKQVQVDVEDPRSRNALETREIDLKLVNFKDDSKTIYRHNKSKIMLINMDLNIDENYLRSIVSKYCSPTSIKILPEKLKNTCNAVIEFPDRRFAHVAMIKLDNVEIFGRKVRASYYTDEVDNRTIIKNCLQVNNKLISDFSNPIPNINQIPSLVLFI